MTEFKVGDKVKHVTGGPVMMVFEVKEDPREGGSNWLYCCEWFDDEAELHRESFRPEALVKHDEGGAKAL